MASRMGTLAGRFEQASTVQGNGAGVVAFVSPFNLDYAANDPDIELAASHVPLSPLSPARKSGTFTGSGGGGKEYGFAGIGRAFKGLAESQETRQDNLGKKPAADAKTTPGNSRRDALTAAELDSLKQYDFGRIQAEMQEWAMRFPDKAGMEVKKPEDNMPMQVIRDHDGNILMKGRAESVEHLIAIKLEEAAKSTNPDKKIVNLAGAQLDERTLGRPLQFQGFNLQNVDLRGANLAGASFKDCQIKNVDMSGAGLKGTTFEQCHIENVSMAEFVGDKKTAFRNSSIQNVDMSYAVAPQIQFENIRGDHINMQGAEFQGAKISNMHVENLWAKEANLEGAKIGDMHVVGKFSSFQDAKLNGASVGSSSFGRPDQPIDMRGMQAQNSVWNNVSISGDLSRADFTGADFVKNVDMRNVKTPEGPMEMGRANLTGLTAGPDAKLRADGAQYEGITMRPAEDFVFSGTDPIKRAANEAMSAGKLEANILTEDGATREAQQAGLVQQRRMQQQMAMAPQPPSPYKKRS